MIRFIDSLGGNATARIRLTVVINSATWAAEDLGGGRP
jgi:hypothetical protein